MIIILIIIMYFFCFHYRWIMNPNAERTDGVSGWKKFLPWKIKKE